MKKKNQRNIFFSKFFFSNFFLVPFFMGHLKKNWAKKERKKSEKRAHSLSKSDDQERTQILKIGVKEWAKSIFWKWARFERSSEKKWALNTLQTTKLVFPNFSQLSRWKVGPKLRKKNYFGQIKSLISFSTAISWSAHQATNFASPKFQFPQFI